jgi:putative membrane protein
MLNLLIREDNRWLNQPPRLRASKVASHLFLLTRAATLLGQGGEFWCSSLSQVPHDDMRLILNWILSALSLVIVARLVPGFIVTSFTAALIAAVVIGLANATIGLVLRIVTFPLTIITFGLFWFVINALMLRLASILVDGFEIRGFFPAFWGAIVLSLVNLFFRMLTRPGEPRGYRKKRSDD